MTKTAWFDRLNLAGKTCQPREEKGPPVTTDIALPGRFLLRTPRRPGLSLSKRLDKDTRQRLRQSLIAQVDDGWTVRTAAAGVPEPLMSGTLPGRKITPCSTENDGSVIVIGCAATSLYVMRLRSTMSPLDAPACVSLL